MPGDVAAALYAARDAGASEAEQQRILAAGLQEHYFRDGGRRADGLDVELTELGWVELDV